MKVGLVVPNRGATAIQNVRELPGLYESLGFSSAWFTDHVVGVRAYEPFYEQEWAEVMTSMAHAAATTETIRLGIGVLVVPYRNPVLAAKMIATVDGLSGGRTVVGLATGWSRAEFHALGQGDWFEDRGKYTDESIEVMTKCWKGGQVDFDGEHFSFRTVTFAPPPLQSPRPPLWIGGSAGRALRRTARWGDAWHPSRLTPIQLALIGDKLDDQAGRHIDRTVRIRVEPDLPQHELAHLLAEYENARCVEVVIELTNPDLATVDRWAHDVASIVGRR